MAIGKNEARASRNKFNEEEMKRVEDRIDAALMNPMYTGKQITISTNLVPTHLWEEMEARYRNAGWTVTYYADQRDGSYWVFE